MRRKEFEVQDPKLIGEVLQTTEIGYLSFIGPDGWPRITPLNFVFDGRVLWHGAIAGERFECLQRNPKATFSTVSLQAYVPSHFTSEGSAIGATTVYQSAIVRGSCSIIEEAQERCKILNMLMDKYQPEGRYKRITPEDPMYIKLLKATAVCALVPESMTGKFKLSQNRSVEDRQRTITKLKERGSPADLQLAEAMQKTLAGTDRH